MIDREHIAIMRAQEIYRALSEPYIKAMVNYMANVPKAPFAVAVLDGTSLVPFEEAD